ncbi:tripartite motif protein, putative [Hepatocystis sp. ex Piliocolobus tephrosceles]|nr:tripartite motif protein, putative [Hepatocystis sp. ex Piliocolobus tephrosceles]
MENSVISSDDINPGGAFLFSDSNETCREFNKIEECSKCSRPVEDALVLTCCHLICLSCASSELSNNYKKFMRVYTNEHNEKQGTSRYNIESCYNDFKNIEKKNKGDKMEILKKEKIGYISCDICDTKNKLTVDALELLTKIGLFSSNILSVHKLYLKTAKNDNIDNYDIASVYNNVKRRNCNNTIKDNNINNRGNNSSNTSVNMNYVDNSLVYGINNHNPYSHNANNYNYNNFKTNNYNFHTNDDINNSIKQQTSNEQEFSQSDKKMDDTLRDMFLNNDKLKKIFDLNNKYKYLDEHIDDLNANSYICNICSENEAVVYCDDCVEYLCSECCNIIHEEETLKTVIDKNIEKKHNFYKIDKKAIHLKKLVKQPKKFINITNEDIELMYNSSSKEESDRGNENKLKRNHVYDTKHKVYDTKYKVYDNDDSDFDNYDKNHFYERKKKLLDRKVEEQEKINMSNKINKLVKNMKNESDYESEKSSINGTLGSNNEFSEMLIKLNNKEKRKQSKRRIAKRDRGRGIGGVGIRGRKNDRSKHTKSVICGHKKGSISSSSYNRNCDNDNDDDDDDDDDDSLVGNDTISSSQVGSSQVGSSQVGSNQVGSNQIGSNNTYKNIYNYKQTVLRKLKNDIEHSSTKRKINKKKSCYPNKYILKDDMSSSGYSFCSDISSNKEICISNLNKNICYDSNNNNSLLDDDDDNVSNSSNTLNNKNFTAIENIRCNEHYNYPIQYFCHTCCNKCFCSECAINGMHTTECNIENINTAFITVLNNYLIQWNEVINELINDLDRNFYESLDDIKNDWSSLLSECYYELNSKLSYIKNNMDKKEEEINHKLDKYMKIFKKENLNYIEFLNTKFVNIERLINIIRNNKFIRNPIDLIKFYQANIQDINKTIIENNDFTHIEKLSKNRESKIFYMDFYTSQIISYLKYLQSFLNSNMVIPNRNV